MGKKHTLQKNSHIGSDGFLNLKMPTIKGFSGLFKKVLSG
jgi:hypothetical protein